MSLGVLKWIHSQVSKEEFCASASFLSYAPVFLMLCGDISAEHPPQRPDVFEVRARKSRVHAGRSESNSFACSRAYFWLATWEYRGGGKAVLAPFARASRPRFCSEGWSSRGGDGWEG